MNKTSKVKEYMLGYTGNFLVDPDTGEIIRLVPADIEGMRRQASENGLPLAPGFEEAARAIEEQNRQKFGK